MIYQDFDKLCENPLVTAFIFTYNQENMVGKTIESVLAQKVSFPYEIVIAEDCSPDNTLKVCKTYYEQYPDIIRVHHNENNQGIIHNYHDTIVECARGKYLAGVAGDDWWHDTNKLQKQVDFLEANPDYGMVFSQTLVYSQSSGELQKYSPNYSPYSFDNLIIQNAISALTTCYRADLFRRYVHEVDPVKQNFPGEDYPFWIWLSHETKLNRIDEPLTTYRLQSETLSHSNDKQKALQFEVDRINIKLFFYNYFKLHEKDILHDIYLRFYYLTLNTASEAENDKIEKDRADFFKTNKYYLLLLLAKLNHQYDSNEKLSSVLKFILKVTLKFRLIDRYYKVYNKHNNDTDKK